MTLYLGYSKVPTESRFSAPSIYMRGGGVLANYEKSCFFPLVFPKQYEKTFPFFSSYPRPFHTLIRIPQGSNDPWGHFLG